MGVDKIALVTGASSGIGEAAALGLARAGFDLVLCARRQEPILAVGRAAEQLGAQTLCVATDVRAPDQVLALFAAIKARFNRLDLVFNNAGRFAPAAEFGDIPDTVWNDMVAVNLNGMFHIARAAFNLMKRQSPPGGRIINNGSISAQAPRPHAAPYTVTKHAVTGLTKAIALDGRPYNIVCGQIDIGNAATDMTTQMQRGMLQADGSVRPEPTFDVAHVVDAIVYMASLPLSTTLDNLTITASGMPFIGRG